MFNALNPMRRMQPQACPVQAQAKPMIQRPSPPVMQPGMAKPQIRPVNALAGVKYGLR